MNIGGLFDIQPVLTASYFIMNVETASMLSCIKKIDIP